MTTATERADWLLYEHDDGRRAVAPSAEAATFTHGEPAWHRVGPVEMPDMPAPSMVDQIRASTEYVSWFPIKPAVRPCDSYPGCNANNCLGCGETTAGVPAFDPDKHNETSYPLGVAPSDAPNRNWWCPTCQGEVPPQRVTYEETHDPRAGGCGSRVLARNAVVDLSAVDTARMADEALAAHVSGVDVPPIHDAVWEALQRLIENAASLGPSSQEDAMVVARWRGQFVAARERASGVPVVQAPSAPKPMQGLADWLRAVAETQAADIEQEACMRQWAREVDAACGVGGQKK